MARILAGVPIRVIEPPSSDEKDSGISSFETAILVRREIDEPGFPIPRQPENAPAHHIGHPRLEQPSRHDIDRPDCDHGRVSKALKDLFGIDQPQQANRQQDQQCNQIHPELFRGKECQ